MWTNMRQKPGSVIDTFKEAFVKKAVTILWIGRFTMKKKSVLPKDSCNPIESTNGILQKVAFNFI